jgi:hypothetical protein
VADLSVREAYLRFASREARGVSVCYQQWAEGVAADAGLAARISQLTGIKRQPQLIFAVARLLGAPADPFPAFREWMLEHWDEVRTEALSRRNQMNEPQRCAVLLPLLATLPQPLALLEVGASAGLCLLPDKYSYQYANRPRLDPQEGPSPLLLTCDTTGPMPQPTKLPDVAWRAGIDLHPLDARSDADAQWLHALISPGQDDRHQRLDAALRIARTNPPHLAEGDLNDTVAHLADQAPPDATLVIFHCGVLTYLSTPQRRAFANTVSKLPAHWISYEGPSVMSSGIYAPLPPSPEPARALFFVASDTQPVAYADGLGQTIHWFG